MPAHPASHHLLEGKGARDENDQVEGANENGGTRLTEDFVVQDDGRAHPREAAPGWAVVPTLFHCDPASNDGEGPPNHS
jgi:hypothetical protein